MGQEGNEGDKVNTRKGNGLEPMTSSGEKGIIGEGIEKRNRYNIEGVKKKMEK